MELTPEEEIHKLNEMVRSFYRMKADDIIKIVASYFKLKPEQITGSSRRKNIIDARFLAIYFVVKYTDLDMKTIPSIVNKDRTTIIYACKKVEERMIYKSYEKNFQYLKGLIDSKLV